MPNKKTLLIRLALLALFCGLLLCLRLAGNLLKRHHRADNPAAVLSGALRPETIRENLKGISDPEIGINIVDLGLIKEITLTGDKDIGVTMILTTPLCPYADLLIYEIKRLIRSMEEGTSVSVKIDLQTPWHPEMISEEGKRQLERRDDDR
ncbi:metal-sulfur cluster assembly factor [Candidatus Omnitrophota bacterium]